MLKWALWLLVLGNAGYFAWSQGYLETLGLAPAEQREPQRLTQQVRPEALKFKVIPPTTSTADPAAVEASGPASALPLDASAPDGAAQAPALPAYAARPCPVRNQWCETK